jgi:ATP-dependent Clp protease ATP-binding subunit ClpA
MLTKQLTNTLRQSMVFANHRQHEFATTEHLLLALLDDPDALDVLRGCGADLEQLRRKLIDFVNHDLQRLTVEGSSDSKPTPGYQRVMQKAAYHAMSHGMDEVNGADVLAAMFLEAGADAIRLLHQHGVSRPDVVKFLPRWKGDEDSR